MELLAYLAIWFWRNWRENENGNCIVDQKNTRICTMYLNFMDVISWYELLQIVYILNSFLRFAILMKKDDNSKSLGFSYKEVC